MNNETAACEKCRSEIPIDAERCPQCQYEPGKPVLGIIGSLLGFLLLFGAIFQVLIGFLLLLTPIVGAPITGALSASGIFLFSGVIQGMIATWLGGYRKRYAADKTKNEGESEEEQKSFSEEIRDGKERGEEWVERATNNIDTLSPTFFSASIAAGTLLLFSTIAAAGTEAEIAWISTESLVGITLFLSMGVLMMTVFADVYRVNRLHGTNFRAWMYALPSMIPFVGFVPAVLWIIRRNLSEATSRSE